MVQYSKEASSPPAGGKRSTMLSKYSPSTIVRFLPSFNVNKMEQIQTTPKVDIEALAKQITELKTEFSKLHLRKKQRREYKRSINLLIKKYNDTVKFKAFQPL
jgi:hypothetical protein